MGKFTCSGLPVVTIIVIIGVVVKSVQCAPEKLITVSAAELPEKIKGDTAEFMTASGPIIPPKWNDGRLKTGGLSTHKNKGDLGLLDPRGSVRYNIMNNGRIARGVITSLADDENPITQAKSNCCPKDTYAPVAV